MKRILKYFKNIILVFIFLIISGAFLVDVTQLMPDNADVMVDDNLKVYYSPMYFLDTKVGGWENLRLTKASEADLKDYTPDEDCRKEGYFVHEESLFWNWLGSSGIIKQKKRWNPDGTWNW